MVTLNEFLQDLWRLAPHMDNRALDFDGCPQARLKGSAALPLTVLEVECARQAVLVAPPQDSHSTFRSLWCESHRHLPPDTLDDTGYVRGASPWGIADYTSEVAWSAGGRRPRPDHAKQVRNLLTLRALMNETRETHFTSVSAGVVYGFDGVYAHAQGQCARSSRTHKFLQGSKGECIDLLPDDGPVTVTSFSPLVRRIVNFQALVADFNDIGYTPEQIHRTYRTALLYGRESEIELFFRTQLTKDDTND